MRTQLCLALTLCAACSGTNNGNNGDDDPAADAMPGNDGGSSDGGSDGSTVDRCEVPPAGGLVKGEAIHVLGRVTGVAVASDDARTYAGNYNTAFAGSLDFAGTPAPNALGTDAFIWRRDASGTTKWLVTLSGAGTDQLFAILDDGAGGIYITGRTSSASLAMGSTTIMTDGLSSVGFIAKLRASDGVAQWAHRITGPVPGGSGTQTYFHSCTELVKSGAHIVAGCNFRGASMTVDGDGGTPIAIPSGTGLQSGVVLAFDTSDGEVSWVTRASSSMANGLIVSSTTAAPNGNFYVAGTYTQGRVDIGHPGGTATMSLPNGSTGRAAFLTVIDGATGDAQAIRIFEDLQANANDGPIDVHAIASDTTLYFSAYTESGLQFAIGSELAPPGGQFLATFPLTTPMPDVPAHVRGIPSSAKFAVDRCDRPSFAIGWVDQADLVLDGVTVAANKTGLLTLDSSTTAATYAGFNPCANAVQSCDPRNAATSIAMTPSGGTIVGGAFVAQIDFGNGATGLGNGEQPFIAEFAP